nr:hypothetical protein QOL21_01535 [Acholeplasma laidlawii]
MSLKLIKLDETYKIELGQMIALSLIECKKLGIKHVLITCDKENIGSAKAIISNGGVLENEVMDENGKMIQRYWIKIT